MARWTKLKNGEWGIRAESWGTDLAESDRVKVQSANGKIKEVEVDRVLWRGISEKDASVRLFLCSVRPVSHRNDWQYRDDTI